MDKETIAGLAVLLVFGLALFYILSNNAFNPQGLNGVDLSFIPTLNPPIITSGQTSSFTLVLNNDAQDSHRVTVTFTINDSSTDDRIQIAPDGKLDDGVKFVNTTPNHLWTLHFPLAGNSQFYHDFLVSGTPHHLEIGYELDVCVTDDNTNETACASPEPTFTLLRPQ